MFVTALFIIPVNWKLPNSHQQGKRSVVSLATGSPLGGRREQGAAERSDVDGCLACDREHWSLTQRTAPLRGFIYINQRIESANLEE